MSVEGYVVNNYIIQIIFYGMVLFGNIVEPFCTVLLIQSKLSNREVICTKIL